MLQQPKQYAVVQGGWGALQQDQSPDSMTRGTDRNQHACLAGNSANCDVAADIKVVLVVHFGGLSNHDHAQATACC